VWTSVTLLVKKYSWNETLRERRKEIIKAFRRFLDLTKKIFCNPAISYV